MAEEPGCRLDDIVLEDAPIDGDLNSPSDRCRPLMLLFRPDDKGVIVSMGLTDRLPFER